MVTTYHPHDKFFKEVMSDIHIAAKFFQQHVPAKILDAIDLDTLSLCKESYFGKNLSKIMLDVLYRVKYKHSKALLYLLAEHQSTADNKMLARIAESTLHIMNHHVDHLKHKKYPLVLPVVLYHGTSDFNHSTQIADYFDAPEHLVAEIYLKPFVLIDVMKIPDAELQQLDLLGSIELLFKHIRSDDLLDNIESIFEPFVRAKYAQNGKLQDFMLSYIISTGNIRDYKELQMIVNKCLGEDKGDTVMTLAQRLRDEGQEIKAIAIAMRLLAEGVDLAFIKRITELSDAQIRELQNSGEIAE